MKKIPAHIAAVLVAAAPTKAATAVPIKAAAAPAA